jgi:hypothetical protein
MSHQCLNALWELTPPLLEQGMFKWWHEVRKREKSKTMLSSTWPLFLYTPKEWAYKVVEIDEPLNVKSTLSKGKHHPSKMPML